MPVSVSTSPSVNYKTVMVLSLGSGSGSGAGSPAASRALCLKVLNMIFEGELLIMAIQQLEDTFQHSL
jgi:hypothetical protein